MDEAQWQSLYKIAQDDEYKGSINDFKILLKSNSNAVKDIFNMQTDFEDEGEFNTAVGLDPKLDFTKPEGVLENYKKGLYDRKTQLEISKDLMGMGVKLPFVGELEDLPSHKEEKYKLIDPETGKIDPFSPELGIPTTIPIPEPDYLTYDQFTTFESEEKAVDMLREKYGMETDYNLDFKVPGELGDIVTVTNSKGVEFKLTIPTEWNKNWGWLGSIKSLELGVTPSTAHEFSKQSYDAFLQFAEGSKKGSDPIENEIRKLASGSPDDFAYSSLVHSKLTPDENGEYDIDIITGINLDTPIQTGTMFAPEVTSVMASSKDRYSYLHWSKGLKPGEMEKLGLTGRYVPSEYDKFPGHGDYVFEKANKEQVLKILQTTEEVLIDAYANPWKFISGLEKGDASSYGFDLTPEQREQAFEFAYARMMEKLPYIPEWGDWLAMAEHVNGRASFTGKNLADDIKTNIISNTPGMEYSETVNKELTKEWYNNQTPGEQAKVNLEQRANSVSHVLNKYEEEYALRPTLPLEDAINKLKNEQKNIESKIKSLGKKEETWHGRKIHIGTQFPWLPYKEVQDLGSSTFNSSGEWINSLPVSDDKKKEIYLNMVTQENQVLSALLDNKEKHISPKQYIEDVLLKQASHQVQISKALGEDGFIDFDAIAKEKGMDYIKEFFGERVAGALSYDPRLGDKVAGKLSYNELYKLGFGSENFEGWLDENVFWTSHVSKEDVNKYRAWESTMNNNRTEFYALSNLVHLNTDFGKIEKPWFLERMTQAVVKQAGMQWWDMSDKDTEELLGDYTIARDEIDRAKLSVDLYNSSEDVLSGKRDKVDLTPEQLGAIHESYNEMVAEGLGEFTPTLVELAALTIATDGVMTELGIARAMTTWRPIYKHLVNGVLEEIKMQTVMDMPATGGATFYTLGAITNNLAFTGRLKWLKPMFDKTIKSGVVGAISAETAGVTELAYDALMGHKDFETEFKRLYGDMDDVTQRVIVNSMVFGFTGVHHLKRTDFMTSSAKVTAMGKLQKKMQEMLLKPDLEGKFKGLPKEARPTRTFEELTKEEQGIYLDYQTTAQMINKAFMAETMALELDPNHKDFKKNFKKRYTDPFNEGMKAVLGEDFKGVEVEVGRGEKWRKQMGFERFEGKDVGNTAQYDKESGKVYLDLDKYTPGKPIHEFTHVAMEAYFKQNKNVEANFVENMSSIFKDFNFSEYSGTGLGRAIENAYGFWKHRETGKKMPGKNSISKEQLSSGKYEWNIPSKELAAKEYLAFMGEFLANPYVYYENKDLASNFIKEIRLEIKDILIESGLKSPKPKTAKDVVQLFALLGKSGRMGTRLQVKASQLAKLEEVDILGYQVKTINELTKEAKEEAKRNVEEELVEQPFASKELESQRSDIVSDKKEVSEKFLANEINRKEYKEQIDRLNNKLGKLSETLEERSAGVQEVYETNIKSAKGKENIDKAIRDIIEPERGNETSVAGRLFDDIVYNAINKKYPGVKDPRERYDLAMELVYDTQAKGEPRGLESIIRKYNERKSFEEIFDRKGDKKLSEEEIKVLEEEYNAKRGTKLFIEKAGKAGYKGKQNLTKTIMEQLKLRLPEIYERSIGKQAEKGFPEDITDAATQRKLVTTGGSRVQKAVELEKVNVTDVIRDKKLRNKFDKIIRTRLKDVSSEGLTFADLKDLAPEITAELFNIPLEKLLDPAKNLSASEVKSINEVLNSSWKGLDGKTHTMVEYLFKLMPPENVVPEQAPSRIKGTSLKLPPVMLNRYYTPTGKRSSGIKSQVKIKELKKGLTEESFKKELGVIDGEFKPDRSISQTLKGSAKMIGDLITNKMARNALEAKMKQQEKELSKVRKKVETDIQEVLGKNLESNKKFKEIDKIKEEAEPRIEELVKQVDTRNTIEDIKTGGSELMASKDLKSNLDDWNGMLKDLLKEEILNEINIERIFDEHDKVVDSDKDYLRKEFELWPEDLPARKGIIEEIDRIFAEELAKESGRSLEEVIDYTVNEYINWKEAVPELGKLFGFDLKYFSEPDLTKPENLQRTLNMLSDVLVREMPFELMPKEYQKVIEKSITIGKQLKINGKRLAYKNFIPELKAKLKSEGRNVTSLHKSGVPKAVTKADLIEVIFGKKALKGKGKYEAWMEHVYQPTNWGYGGGFKSQMENKLVELKEKHKNWETTDVEVFQQSLAEYARDLLTSPIFKERKELKTGELVLDPNGKVIVENGYELTMKANRSAIKRIYKNLAKKFKEKPTKETLEDIINFLKLQTNHIDGVLKGLVPMESVTTIVEGPKAKKSHNEHMIELFNYNDRFIKILAKHKSNTTSKKSFKEIDGLVEELSQAWTSEAEKLVKDKDGASRQFSKNKTVNTFQRKKAATTQVSLIVEPGKTVAEIHLKKYDEAVIRDVLKEIYGNENADGKELEQKYKNKGENNKVHKKNIKTAEDSGIYASKDLTNNEILNNLKNRDEALRRASLPEKSVKKIRVFDFDQTLATTNSRVIYSASPEAGKMLGHSTSDYKVIFMSGGPGSGKSSIRKQIEKDNPGFEVIDSDQAYKRLKKEQGLPAAEAKMTKEQRSLTGKAMAQAVKTAKGAKEQALGTHKGIIIDGTGASSKALLENKELAEALGYDAHMVSVKTSLETAKERNRTRAERSLLTRVVEKVWNQVEGNTETYRKAFGENYTEINSEKMKMGDPLPEKAKSNINKFTKDYVKGKINSKQFAEFSEQMKTMNAKFDYSEFIEVIEGAKGPVFEVAKIIKEKRGNEDLFVLTARPQESAVPIQEFLKGIGLDLKVENITGLGSGDPNAKAEWMVGKAAEGYNDFYFADDHTGNIKAVKKALEPLDVKSRVQQIMASKDLNKDFNVMLQQKTGIEWYKKYSPVKAKTIGSSKGKFKFFIPPSAEDFVGLLYPTLGKGKLGDAHMAWYKENLLNPYAKAMESISKDRIQLTNDFKELKKQLSNVPKNLRKKAFEEFTYENVIRAYVWNKQGMEIPGMSKKDLVEIDKFVKENPELQVFGDQLIAINKGDGYIKPGSDWLAGTITTDLIRGLNTNKRTKYLEQWQANVDIIFSKENLNKLEAAFGSKYREAMENMLTRMRTGSNRTSTAGRLENRVLDYINNSVGAVMFLNMRSATLQTISAVNFLNWGDNNPMKAGKAFANQPQYWRDFMELMNSDFLVERRNGLKINVSESEIADAAASSSNKARGAISYILKKGFVATQFADSFAIASGGATFYRNRLNKYLKEGMSDKKAKEQAFEDFREIAEESQQSARPDRISQQQASGLGRVILAFANTPMQYTRIMKKAALDLKHGRGDTKANISKLIYYGVIQNIMFNAIQQAIFALDWDDDIESEAKVSKYKSIANGMLDSVLRGTGIAGVALATVKNLMLDIYERSGKKRPEYADAAYKLLDFSPPIDIKVSKIRQAGNNWEYNQDLINERGFSIDNPAYMSAALVISATTNIPLDRILKKFNNVSSAMETDQETWKRVALMLGWPEWQLQSPEEKAEERVIRKEKQHYKKAEEDPKFYNKEEQIDILKKHGYSEEEIEGMTKEEDRVNAILKAQEDSDKIYTPEKLSIQIKEKKDEVYDLSKSDQIRILKNLGLSDEEIKELRIEGNRVNKILKLRDKDSKKVDKVIKDQKEYKPTDEEKKSIEIFDLNKDEQIDILKEHDLSDKEIKALKYEKDRVEKILELQED